MSAVASLASAPSRVFDAGCDVLADHAGRSGRVLPAVRFGAAQWDFREVPGRPAYLHPSQLHIDWQSFTPERWTLTTKELLAAMLLPHDLTVALVPGRSRQPLGIGHIHDRLKKWRRWLRWLDGQGICSLGAVTQDICDEYLATHAGAMKPYSAAQSLVTPLRDFATYGQLLSDRYPEGFRPWGWTPATRVAGARKSYVNLTPVIPEPVFGPVVAGALFHVETAATDIIAGRDELRALQSARSRCRDLDAALEQVLGRYRAAGRPLPLHARVQPTTSGKDDPLRGLNLDALTLRGGFRLTRAQLTTHRRALLLAAADDLGLTEEDLWTPISSIERTDGTLGPWRPPFASALHQFELRRLVTACWVVASLSGMRGSELEELRPGCLRRVCGPDDSLRWRLHSVVVKRRPLGGDAESWTVIDCVAQAVQLLERLVPEDWEGLLFSGSTWATTVGARSQQRLNMNVALRRLVEWQNTHGVMAGLPVVPDFDGHPWRLAPKQFRRTLARELALRPHGTLAAKVHLKQVHVAVTEGYFGARGESAAALLDEVEEEEKEVRMDTLMRRYEEHRQGRPLLGGAAKELRDEFEAIDRDMEGFRGTVEQSQRRLRLLLHKRASTLHIGLLNDCHFTDRRRARCLRGTDVEKATGPRIAVCEPTKCANATLSPEHAPVWRESLVQVEDLLGDRKLPRNERERLRAERDRLRGIVEPLEAR